MPDRPPAHLRRVAARRAAAAAAATEAPAETVAETVAGIDRLTRAARNSWFGLLAYLAFAGITLMGVKDADFYLPERETALPLVGVSVPTFLFFWIAPGLGAALFVYLHLGLLRLWPALAAPPAQAGGLPLSARYAPSLVADMALGRRGDPGLAGRPLGRLADAATFFLVFLATPLLLAAFLLRSQSARDEALSLIGCGLPLLLAIHVALESAAQMRRRLRAVTVAAGLVIALQTWFATEGTLAQYARNWAASSRGDGWVEGRWWAGTPLPGLLAPVDLAGIDFVGVPSDWRDFEPAQKAFRLDWCAGRGMSPALCAALAPGEMPPEIARLRREGWCLRLPEYAELAGAPAFPLADAPEPEDHLLLPAWAAAECDALFDTMREERAEDWAAERAARLRGLTARDLTGADLRGANLAGARLDGAGLSGARMDGAMLERARMEGARLYRARMIGANLADARLEGADLQQARMEDAYAVGARLAGADLSGARMNRAFLWRIRAEGTRFEGARLRWARFNDALLSESDFTAADLRDTTFFDTRLRDVTLAQARLDGALFVGADAAGLRLEGATLADAGLHGINLRGSGVDATAIAAAYGDGSVRLPAGLVAGRPPLAHWPAERLSREVFLGRYESWRGERDPDYRRRVTLPPGLWPPDPAAVRRLDDI